MKVWESDEERLAREAAAKIRAWAEKRRKVSGENLLPRMAIRFCGGCNPAMDRGQVARIIHEDLAGLVRWVPAEEVADLLLVISGCLTACGDRPEITEKAAEYLVIAGPTIFSIQGNEGKERR